MDSQSDRVFVVALLWFLSYVGSSNSVKCSDPGIPPHGSRIPSSRGPFEVGTTLRYSCNAPYKLEPSEGKKLFCEKNGQWNGKAPQCIATECSRNLPVIPHANPVKTSAPHAVGTTIKYRCDSGYRAVGSTQVTCEKDGNWAGNVTCAVVTCGKPTQLANGNVTYTSIDYSSTATYTCRSGFVFREIVSSNFTVKCGDNGQWVPLARYRCVRTCPCFRLPNPNNGHVTYSNPRRTAASTATIYCSKEHRLVGPKTVTCLLNGMWSSKTRCEISGCGQLSTPNHGQATYNCCKAEPQVYTHVMFSCNTGYTLIGPRSKICLPSGKWSTKASPACQEISCREPGSIQYGNFTPVHRSYPFNTEVTYQCHAGHYIFGSRKTVTCNMHGEWSGSPQCLTLADFEEQCKKKGMAFSEERPPQCIEHETATPSASSNHGGDLDTLTIVTASAGSTLGALVILLSVLICLKKLANRRRVRRHSSRGRHYSDDDRIAFVAYAGDVHFMLPSYDEAMSQVQRSPPPFEAVVPTGDERLANTNNNEMTADNGILEGAEEGPTVVEAVGTPLYEPSTDSERRINIVSNPLVADEGVSTTQAASTPAGQENGGLSRSESLHSETDSESGSSESRPLIGQADRGVMV